MHIIVPMSGVGQRFLDAGYDVPKPLIEIDGRPIIEHVVNLFPGETRFTFICNATHLENTPMRQVLQRIAPQGEVVAIAPHKLGPVHAVRQVADRIADDEEVIVNYCDFGTYWDYADFLHHTRTRQADGAVPAYRGFHPHMLGTTNYAFMRDDAQWMQAIQEKRPFTDNRMQEFASNGTYYFRTGALVKHYFKQLMDRGEDLNGEYYVSMVYNLLAQDGLKVSIYEVQHMLQWGTPEDVAEYTGWSRYFRQVITLPAPISQQPPAIEACTLLPLAGRGQRFAREGYALPKPLLPVGGRPMVVQALNHLPPTTQQRFVCLSDHLAQTPLAQALMSAYPQAQLVSLSTVTEGQACTCVEGLRDIAPDTPLLIGACDNGMLYDVAALRAKMADPQVDALVFTATGHPHAARHPHQYGWVQTEPDGVQATGVAVKQAISATPANDATIVGAFYFRQARLLTEALADLKARNERVNGEFYVDSCVGALIAMGYRVEVFPVDAYLCWGTPDDYQTYHYWQSFFHKCDWHPYRLELDPFVPPDAVADLHTTYTTFRQAHPPWPTDVASTPHGSPQR